MQQQKVIDPVTDQPIAAPFKERQCRVRWERFERLLSVATQDHLRSDPTPQTFGVLDLDVQIRPVGLVDERKFAISGLKLGRKVGHFVAVHYLKAD